MQGMSSTYTIDWDALNDAPERARTFKRVTPLGEVWYKRAEKDFRNKLQVLLDRHTASASEQQEEEIACIQAVARRGFLVPEVLHVAPDYMVLSDIGPSLHQLMHKAEAETRRRLTARAAALLQTLHESAGWHGNAVLRNMVDHNNEQIGLIDFERTARPGWSLARKQSYDLWQLLYSTARFDRTSTLARHALQSYGDGPARRRLRWFSLLALPVALPFVPFQEIMKRDFAQIVVTIYSIMYNWIY